MQPFWMCFPHQGSCCTAPGAQPAVVRAAVHPSRAELLEQALLCCPGPASPREARLAKRLGRLDRAAGDSGERPPKHPEDPGSVLLHKCNSLSLEHLMIKPLLKIGWPWMAPGHILLCKECWDPDCTGTGFGGLFCAHTLRKIQSFQCQDKSNPRSCPRLKPPDSRLCNFCNVS